MFVNQSGQPDCKKYVKTINDLNSKEPIEDSELFKRYCFLIELSLDNLETGDFSWRLISTDLWLSEEQIACFQVMIKLGRKQKNRVYEENFTPVSWQEVSILFVNIWTQVKTFSYI